MGIFPRVFAIFIAICCVAGCASTIPQKDLGRMQRLGVISIVAEKLNRTYVGVLVFGNEREEKDVSSWGLDKAYEAQIASAVESKISAKIIPTTHDASNFRSLNDTSGPAMLAEPNWSNVAVSAKKFCVENNLDGVFFLTRAQSGGFFGPSSNQFLEGVGVYASGSTSGVYISSRLTLLDCTSLKPLGEEEISAGRFLEPEIAKKPLSNWSEEDEKVVHQNLIEVPTYTLNRKLDGMLRGER